MTLMFIFPILFCKSLYEITSYQELADLRLKFSLTRPGAERYHNTIFPNTIFIHCPVVKMHWVKMAGLALLCLSGNLCEVKEMYHWLFLSSNDCKLFLLFILGLQRNFSKTARFNYFYFKFIKYKIFCIFVLSW